MDTPSSAPAVDPALGYAAAFAELRQIVDQLEGPDLDVDQLAAKVARAAALVEHCRAKVEAARAQVKLFDVHTGAVTQIE